MKFLIDNALSPLLAQRLREAGHDAVHLRERGMQSIPDREVFALASDEGRILVSADTDFGAILAWWEASHPSVILFRRGLARRSAYQANTLLPKLADLQDALERGSIVVMEPGRIRIRTLPL
ncbi:MAG: DUF5615 family PIN-like protein [Chloroflexi bacterium]|nr:DUF5615 family PIN-like protein [Chloroflexota bacterium]